MKRINYKSDFDFILKLVSCVKADDGTITKTEVGFPDHDWSATFWTSSKANAYVASSKGGVLTNCFNDDGQIHVVCNAHKLGVGELKCEYHAALPNVMYPDGSCDVYEPQELDIVLWAGQSDCPTEMEVEVSVPYVYINTGGGATDEQLQRLQEQINSKQDKLISGTNIKTINSQSILGKGNIEIGGGTSGNSTALFADMWASIGGTKLANGNYRMGANGKELSLEEALIRYERNTFIEEFNNRSTWYYSGKPTNEGGYNETTGYFELNGLLDITYEQAIDILSNAQYSETALYRQYHGRTTFRPNGNNHSTVASAFDYSQVEVIKSPIIAGNGCFSGCTKLRKITVYSPNGGAGTDTYNQCKALEELIVDRVDPVSFSLKDSPLLSLESIQRLVTKRSTDGKAITITLHPDAYAKLTEDILTQATAKNITFATA